MPDLTFIEHQLSFALDLRKEMARTHATAHEDPVAIDPTCSKGFRRQQFSFLSVLDSPLDFRAVKLLRERQVSSKSALSARELAEPLIKQYCGAKTTSKALRSKPSLPRSACL